MSNKAKGKNNIQSGRDTIVQSLDLNEYGIIDDIFENVLNKIKDSSPIDTKSSNVQDKLIHINKKIEINFKRDEEREEIKQYFTQLFTKITIVESIFQTLDTEQQNDIHYYILNCYNGYKRDSSISNPVEILEKLSLNFLPNNQFKNPTYNSIARAIVLFFFDDCTIFEKTDTEPKQHTLFDL